MKAVRPYTAMAAFSEVHSAFASMERGRQWRSAAVGNRPYQQTWECHNQAAAVTSMVEPGRRTGGGTHATVGTPSSPEPRRPHDYVCELAQAETLLS